MTSLAERTRVAEGAETLWRMIGSFGGVGEWHPMLAKVTSEGEQKGSLRIAETRDGSRQTERLLEKQPGRHAYRYRMEKTAMPVRDYVSELRVEDNGDETSTVVWSADFEPTADKEKTVEAIRGFLRAGLDNIGTRCTAGMSNQPPTVVDVVADGLVRHGVEFILGQSVPTALVLACEDRGIRNITYREENMGGAIADGFARASGRVPVLICQNGPAAALAVAPFAEAMKAGTPIVAIMQEVDRSHIGKNAFQEYDHKALFAPVTKWLHVVDSADGIDDHLDRAFVAAASGKPGPAVLMLPVDLHKARAGKVGRRETRLGNWPIDRPRPDDGVIVEAAKLINDARLPIVIAGGGVHSSGAGEALLRFAEKATAPVATTSMGKGAIPETHPLAMGVIGNLTGPGGLGRQTKPLVKEADLVLLIGNRTNEDGTDGWSLIADDARVLHIDIDPQEIGRNYEAVRLLGDARATLDALTDALGSHARDRGAIERRIASAWEAFEDERAPFLADAEPIRAERVLASIQKRLGPETVIAADASYSSSWVAGQLRTRHATTRVISPRGLAGLGWGLPLALGAKLARPNADVIVVVGDGGFAHGWAEMETAVRIGIKVTVVVLNNGVLGYQKDAEMAKFGRYTAAGHLGHVDHASIAHACGGYGERVEHARDLDAAFDRAAGSDKLALLDVLTDPGGHPPIALYDGTLDRLENGHVIQNPVP
ncbi:acetolactate synthase catalytic subunit [Mesorhizobium sp. B2-6-2]|uniref:acetolactate synthase catalytic subunit n=1 Tax=Mesorhizobium sp. B2-6-2 TaxID=2589915 RepID=UPI00112C62F8|nr:acetolactate synthase catalytic subunit [Mesorhizobium sp. B2-6-2]TPJ77168.1 acetolactate synthase catalytic subunit [Mesorhizobium sp. B2-6-2]